MDKKILTYVMSFFIVILGFIVFKKKGNDKNVYIENLGTDIPTLNPHNCSDLSSIRVMLDIYEGLVDYDMDLNIIPSGCKNYEVKNENRTYIFHLRENAKWSNGDNVTAEDYVYSLRRAVDTKTLVQDYIEKLLYIFNAK